MRDDLLVFDNEYKYAKDEIKDYSKVICDQMKQYAISVRYIIENGGIKDGNVISSLEEVLSKIDNMQEEVVEIGKKASSLCDDYIKTLDKNDDYLYWY